MESILNVLLRLSELLFPAPVPTACAMDAVAPLSVNPVTLNTVAYSQSPITILVPTGTDAAVALSTLIACVGLIVPAFVRNTGWPSREVRITSTSLPVVALVACVVSRAGDQAAPAASYA